MRLITCAAAILLASCSTPYQQAPQESHWVRRGYSEVQISNDTYEVSFHAASPEEKRARDFALLRSAEICGSRQYPYFLILGENVTGGESTTLLLGLFRNSSPLSANLRFRCLRESMGNTALETMAVQESLRTRYEITRS